VDQGILDVNHVNALGATSGGVLLAGGSLTLRTSISGRDFDGQRRTPAYRGDQWFPADCIGNERAYVERPRGPEYESRGHWRGHYFHGSDQRAGRH